MRIQQFEEQQKDHPHYHTDDIHLLSIGTGKAQYSLSPPGPDAGLLYWAPRVAEVMGASQTAGIHLPLKFLLEDRYQHVNFKMEKRWPLDAVEHLPNLFRVGQQRAEENFEVINEKFFQHKRKKFVPFTTTENEIQMEEFGFQ